MPTFKPAGPLTKEDVNKFLNQIDFALPKGFVEMMSLMNGANIDCDDYNIFLYPLTDMISINQDMYEKGFPNQIFLVASTNRRTNYVIDKNSGNIYELPFEGNTVADGIYVSGDFGEFMDNL